MQSDSPETTGEEKVARVLTHLRAAFGVADLNDLRWFCGSEDWWRDQVKMMLDAAFAPDHEAAARKEQVRKFMQRESGYHVD